MKLVDSPQSIVHRQTREITMDYGLPTMD